MYLLARWLITALAVMLAAYLVPGITVSGLYTALWVALVLGIINAIIRPILLLLTLPINLLTLGLFTFVLNGLLFWFVAGFIEGVEVTGFVPAFIGALIISVAHTVGEKVFRKT